MQCGARCDEAKRIAERRRSNHAAHAGGEIGVAGRATAVLDLRDSNRQRTMNSGGERDEDARSIAWRSDLPARYVSVHGDFVSRFWLFPVFIFVGLRCVHLLHGLSLHWAPLLEKGGKGVGYSLLDIPPGRYA